jgi:hypothetical protein
MAKDTKKSEVKTEKSAQHKQDKKWLNYSKSFTATSARCIAKKADKNWARIHKEVLAEMNKGKKTLGGQAAVVQTPAV